MNRLLELERELKNHKIVYGKQLGKFRRVRPAVARSFAMPVNYHVPGAEDIDVVKQPSKMTCWAAATTMMVSWKEGQSISTPDVLADIGKEYVEKFNRKKGLLSSEKARFLAAAGLEAEAPVNLTISGWEDMLRTYGPLWVTTDKETDEDFTVHARIMTGIYGDGTPNGTFVKIINPAGGRKYDEKFSKFVKEYEKLIADTGRACIQIVHWPRDARYSKSKSYYSPPDISSSTLQRDRFSRATGAGAGVAIAGLGFTIINKMLENSGGDIKWTLQRMNGAKHPGDKEDIYDKFPFKPKTFTVSHEDGGLADKISAEFEVRFKYNGHSVGYIEIENTGTDDAVGWGLDVNASIMPDPNVYQGNIAAVEVVFNYRFHRSIGSDVIYIDRYKIFGNGKISETHTVPQNPKF